MRVGARLPLPPPRMRVFFFEREPVASVDVEAVQLGAHLLEVPEQQAPVDAA